MQPNPMQFLILVACLLIPQARGSQAQAAKAQQTPDTQAATPDWPSTYRPPNFQKFFANNPEGGKELDRLYATRNQSGRGPAATLDVVHQGFAHTTATRGRILTWIGEKYIWEKQPENSQALEIFYHAADHRPYAEKYGALYKALYFGLTITKQKTPGAIRTLCDVALYSEDPATIVRVSWGLENQKEELLQALAPHLKSDSPVVAQKARDLKRIFTGKLKAFVWFERLKTKRIENPIPEDLSALLPQLQEAKGENFKTRLTECIAWKVHHQVIKDPLFWVELSKNPDPELRALAVHHGLARLTSEDPAILDRALEMARTETNPSLLAGLQLTLAYREKACIERLQSWIDGNDPDQKAWAQTFLGKFQSPSAK